VLRRCARRGVTLDGWGARLGVSRTTVQRWERGERVPDPGAETTLLAYCREAGCSAPATAALAGRSLTADLLRPAHRGALARERQAGRCQPPSRSTGDHQTDATPHDEDFFHPPAKRMSSAAELAAVRRVQAGTRL
jgi:transcriptional regulator with XRE-family HTH domain